MKNFRTVLMILIPLLLIVEGYLLYKKNVGVKAAEYIVKKKAESFIKNKIENIIEKIQPKKVSESIVEISTPPQEYKTVDDLYKQLQTWSKEAPSLTEMVSYGKTANGTECFYLRAGNKDKPKVLIQAGLNGDEEYAILATMQMINSFLAGYNRNDDITWALDNRDIYFVPVSSPDTFLKNEKIEGFNPSTSFPYPKKPNNASPSAIKLLMSLANDMKFKAVINMHTYGESVYGPEICSKDDGDKINNLLKKVCGLNGYKTDRLENAHGSGNDVDWFYSSGAASIKMLWGKNSKQYVSFAEIAPSVQRNLPAILTFIKEGTELELRPTPLRTIYYYEFE